MTCIAAAVDKELGVIYLAAERGCADADNKLLAMSTPKIHKAQKVMFAVSGSLARGNLVEATFREFIEGEKWTIKGFLEDFPEFLADAFENSSIVGESTPSLFGSNDDEDSHSWDLLVCYKARLFLVDEDYAIVEIEGPWAIGSGSHIALGAMYGRPPTTLTVENAVAAAIRYDRGCRGPIDVFTCGKASLQLHNDIPQLELDEDGHYPLVPNNQSQNQGPSLG